MTYAGSGVDIRAKDAAARALLKAARFARPPGPGAPIGPPGHYAGMVEFGEHALVLCTDGVGSKLEVANAMRKWDTVGIDCVAMNVNDAVCVGAEPLAFVDYLAVERADAALASELGKGLDEGCRQANVSLVGGETAILPGLVKGFDLAGTCLAVVRKDRILTGERVRPGDAVVGVASSGIHSNGYTLACKALEAAGHAYTDKASGGRSLGDVLLEPTRIYVRAALECLAAHDVHGIAHVTGSGLLNLPRLRRDVRWVLDDPLPIPAVFDLVREAGSIAEDEMHRTFNMGMGLAVVVPGDEAEAAASLLARHFPAKVVGKIVEGKGIAVPSRSVELAGSKF